MKYTSTHLTTVLFIMVICASVPAQVFRGYYADGKVSYPKEDEEKTYTITGHYPDGQVEYIAPYHKRELEGIVKEFYPDGTLRAEISFHNGRRDELARFYWPDGTMMAKIVYSRGRETGAAKYFNQDGSLKGISPEIAKETRVRKRYERLIEE